MKKGLILVALAVTLIIGKGLSISDEPEDSLSVKRSGQILTGIMQVSTATGFPAHILRTGRNSNVWYRTLLTERSTSSSAKASAGGQGILWKVSKTSGK